MKHTLLLFFSVFATACLGQTEKLISGKVVSEGNTLANIDIVNIDSKANTTTDSSGNFSILAKIGDILFIISKEYTDRKITLSEKHFTSPFTIELEKKPIELEDVNITRVKSMKIKLSEADLNAARIYKESNTPKVLGVYDGTTPGVDFMRLGRQIIDIFRSKDKKKSKKTAPLAHFSEYIRSTFADSFFVQTLKIPTEEIGLFVSFCEADPNAKSFVETNDFFASMNFLFTKSEGFKKINNTEK